MEALLKHLALPSPLQEVHYAPWKEAGLSVFFKRDDLIHPLISGNKWRKLYGHLEAFRQKGSGRIVTFGGAYSNHLVAVAAACRHLDIPAVAVVRGEIDELNPALRLARSAGMTLYPVSRADYRLKDTDDFISECKSRWGADSYILPEGGSGEAGLAGCRQIIEEISVPFDHIITACGTGTTLAGIIRYLPVDAGAIGISVLKGTDTLTETVGRLVDSDRFKVITGYHFGGYGRKDDRLLSFIRQFRQATDIPLDFVYTGKMVYAVDDLIRQRYFSPGSRLVLLHTGGLLNAPVPLHP